MNIEDIPEWLKNGDLYRSFDPNDEEVNIDFIRTNEEVNNLDDFKEVLNVSLYWILDKFPYTLFVYAYYNNSEVLNYLETKSENKYLEEAEEILKNEIPFSIFEKFLKENNFPKKDIDNIRKSDQKEDDFLNLIKKNLNKIIKDRELLVKARNFFDRNVFSKESIEKVFKSDSRISDTNLRSIGIKSSETAKKNILINNIKNFLKRNNFPKSVLEDFLNSKEKEVFFRNFLKKNGNEYYNLFNDIKINRTLVYEIKEIISFYKKNKNLYKAKEFLKEYKKRPKYDFESIIYKVPANGRELPGINFKLNGILFFTQVDKFFDESQYRHLTNFKINYGDVDEYEILPDSTFNIKYSEKNQSIIINDDLDYLTIKLTPFNMLDTLDKFSKIDFFFYRYPF